MRSSLVLAAHNEGDLLWRTIESCVQATLELQREIVVADDASWDGSVDEARRRFPEIRVFRHDERKGASPTKDLGARQARGDVLVFLDSHCKPEPGAITRLVEDVERLNGTAIGHRFQSRFESFQVPLEQLIVNQLRLARKNFTDSVWSDWADRCRRRHPGTLADHPEGLWARVWNLFAELRTSADHERSHLLARRVHDEFWYAGRFNLNWPKLHSNETVASPTRRSLDAAMEDVASDTSGSSSTTSSSMIITSSGETDSWSTASSGSTSSGTSVSTATNSNVSTFSNTTTAESTASNQSTSQTTSGSTSTTNSLSTASGTTVSSSSSSAGSSSSTNSTSISISSTSTTASGTSSSTSGSSNLSSTTSTTTSSESGSGSTTGLDTSLFQSADTSSSSTSSSTTSTATNTNNWTATAISTSTSFSSANSTSSTVQTQTGTSSSASVSTSQITSTQTDSNSTSGSRVGSQSSYSVASSSSASETQSLSTVSGSATGSDVRSDSSSSVSSTGSTTSSSISSTNQSTSSTSSSTLSNLTVSSGTVGVQSSSTSSSSSGTGDQSGSATGTAVTSSQVATASNLVSATDGASGTLSVSSSIGSENLSTSTVGSLVTATDGTTMFQTTYSTVTDFVTETATLTSAGSVTYTTEVSATSQTDGTTTGSGTTTYTLTSGTTSGTSSMSTTSGTTTSSSSVTGATTGLTTVTTSSSATSATSSTGTTTISATSTSETSSTGSTTGSTSGTTTTSSSQTATITTTASSVTESTGTTTTSSSVSGTTSSTITYGTNSSATTITSQSGTTTTSSSSTGASTTTYSTRTSSSAITSTVSSGSTTTSSTVTSQTGSTGTTTTSSSATSGTTFSGTASTSSTVTSQTSGLFSTTSSGSSFGTTSTTATKSTSATTTSGTSSTGSTTTSGTVTSLTSSTGTTSTSSSATSETTFTSATTTSSTVTYSTVSSGTTTTSGWTTWATSETDITYTSGARGASGSASNSMVESSTASGIATSSTSGIESSVATGTSIVNVTGTSSSTASGLSTSTVSGTSTGTSSGTTTTSASGVSSSTSSAIITESETGTITNSSSGTTTAGSSSLSTSATASGTVSSTTSGIITVTDSGTQTSTASGTLSVSTTSGTTFGTSSTVVTSVVSQIESGSSTIGTSSSSTSGTLSTSGTTTSTSTTSGTSSTSLTTTSFSSSSSGVSTSTVSGIVSQSSTTTTATGSQSGSTTFSGTTTSITTTSGIASSGSTSGTSTTSGTGISTATGSGTATTTSSDSSTFSTSGTTSSSGTQTEFATTSAGTTVSQTNTFSTTGTFTGITTATGLETSSATQFFTTEETTTNSLTSTSTFSASQSDAVGGDCPCGDIIAPLGDPITANDDTATTNGTDPVTINVLANDFATTGFAVSLTLTTTGDSGISVPIKNGTPADACDWYASVSGTGKINGGAATIALSNFVYSGYSVSPSGDCAIGNWTGTVVIAKDGVELKTFSGANLQTTMCVNALLDCFKSTTSILTSTGLEVHLGRFVGLYPGQSTVQIQTSGFGKTDAFGPPTIITILSTPGNGTAEIVGNAIKYTPFTEANLFDSFAYQITDALGQIGTATVTVNGPPVFDASDWRFYYDGSTELVGRVTATDPDGDALTFSSLDAGPTFRVDADGSIHHQSGVVLSFPQTYEFTVSVTDGNNPAVNADVQVITPIIQTVAATNDVYYFNPGDGSPIESPYSVLLNDVTNALSPLHARLIPGTSQGTLTLQDDGTFTYVPVPRASYVDTFVYQAWFDPQGGLADPAQSSATITINMYFSEEDLLEANDDAYDASIRDTTGVYRANVLDNDTLGGVPFVPGSTTTVTRVSGAGPRFGSVILHNDGKFEYTPNSGYIGLDSFVYLLADNGQQDEAVVSINVQNSPPVINNQTFIINSGFRGQIGRVAASDQNTSQLLRYTLNSTNPNVNFFAISANGVLTTAGTDPVRVDATTSFQLSVTVTDNGSPSLSASATITVQIIKQPIEIFLKSVYFTNNWTITPDPGEGISYPIVEFDIDAFDPKNPTPVFYHWGDTIRATVTFNTSSDILRSIQVRPKWPITAVSDIQYMAIPAGPSTTTRQITCLLPRSVLYVENFEINFEASFDDGGTWNPIGTSGNVLYVSANFRGSPAIAPYRTVLHIATKYANGATDAWTAFDGIWTYFKSLAVTKWNGNNLSYNHINTSWDSVQELLTNSESTCVGWSHFFLDILHIHGCDIAVGASRQSIWAKKLGVLVYERPDIVIQNVRFGVPTVDPSAPPGFEFNWDDSLSVNTGISGLPGQNNKMPLKIFSMHSVVTLGDGRIFDPAYGGVFATLLDWEKAALAGISVLRDGVTYVRRRWSGEQLTYFGIFN